MRHEEDERAEQAARESGFRPQRWLMGLVCFVLIGLYGGTVGVLAYYLYEQRYSYRFWEKEKQARRKLRDVHHESIRLWDNLQRELNGKVSEETLEKLDRYTGTIVDVEQATDREFGNVCMAFADDQLRMNKVAAISLGVSAGAGGFVMLVLAILLIAAARPASPASDWEWEKKHYRKA